MLKRDIPPTAIMISHNAARITPIDGTNSLNTMKTVTAMKRNAKIIAT